MLFSRVYIIMLSIMPLFFQKLQCQAMSLLLICLLHVLN